MKKNYVKIEGCLSVQDKSEVAGRLLPGSYRCKESMLEKGPKQAGLRRMEGR